MRKLLVIVGPTAVGKTALALELARKFSGDLLVADSRQVYRGMDVAVGKDVPENSKFNPSTASAKGEASLRIGHWQTADGTRIWLTDLVDPNEEFSVSHWYKAYKDAVSQVWKDGKLPILVGGTGLYVKAALSGIGTINIPPDKKLRRELSSKSANALYQIFSSLDTKRAQEMNYADRHNPRRLVRAIEIVEWKAEDGERVEDGSENMEGVEAIDKLIIGLTSPLEILGEKIHKRVEDRVRHGAVEETKGLLSSGASSQAESSLGYKQLKNYLGGKFSLESAIKEWKREEVKYAKRQMVWFRKEESAHWFKVHPRFQENVEKVVEKWYIRG